MPLQPGTTLGPYAVTAKIGADVPAVGRDGDLADRVVLPNVEPDAPGAPGQVTFLLNFFEELQARVPTGR